MLRNIAFAVFLLFWFALPANAQSVGTWLLPNNPALVYTSPYDIYGTNGYDINALMYGGSGTGVSFAFTGNTILIYRFLGDEFVYGGAWRLCVDSVCGDPAPTAVQFGLNLQDFEAPVVYYSDGCGAKTGAIEKLDGMGLALSKIVILVDQNCMQSAASAPSPSYRAVSLVTPEAYTAFSEINGKSVAFDHTISAGQVVIAMVSTALLVVVVLGALVRKLS